MTGKNQKLYAQQADKVITVYNINDIPFPVGTLSYKITVAKLKYVGWYALNYAGVKTFIHLAKGITI